MKKELIIDAILEQVEGLLDENYDSIRKAMDDLFRTKDGTASFKYPVKLTATIKPAGDKTFVKTEISYSLSFKDGSDEFTIDESKQEDLFNQKGEEVAGDEVVDDHVDETDEDIFSEEPPEPTEPQERPIVTAVDITKDGQVETVIEDGKIVVKKAETVDGPDGDGMFKSVESQKRYDEFIGEVSK